MPRFNLRVSFPSRGWPENIRRQSSAGLRNFTFPSGFQAEQPRGEIRAFLAMNAVCLPLPRPPPHIAPLLRHYSGTCPRTFCTSKPVRGVCRSLSPSKNGWTRSSLTALFNFTYLTWINYVYKTQFITCKKLQVLSGLLLPHRRQSFPTNKTVRAPKRSFRRCEFSQLTDLSTNY